VPDLNPEQFDYRMQHQPSDYGRFHEADKAYPDIYAHPEYYSTGNREADAESMHHIRRAKGDPNARVPMYRAVPKSVNQINPGDWVTASRTYAEEHAHGMEDWHVLRRQAKAHDLTHTSDSINELGYVGEHPQFTNSKEGNKASESYWKAHGK
jgi:hypothetical protein